MTSLSESARSLTDPFKLVRLRGAGDVADALPYLLGHDPDNSVVIIGVHRPHGRLLGRVYSGIPSHPAGWRETAEAMASCLVEESTKRNGAAPDAALVCLCQAPAADGRGHDVKERLRPLAQLLRTSCGALDVPVVEALCLSGGRYWSYCCATDDCCPPAGNELPRAGSSPMAAAAAYAGIQVRTSPDRQRERLAPLAGDAAARQVRAFDAASAALIRPMLGASGDVAAVRAATLELAERVIARFRRAPAAIDEVSPDARDDALITSEEAARLILGLQDRVARDFAGEWMEGAEAPAALRLWRALARRCVGEFAEHAAPPLTLAGWVAWSTGDLSGAQAALARALETDPEYTFARLLFQAYREGADPEGLRRCMREQRADRRR
ncbi:DUF4192 domain-containing protein [Streptomyces sp. MP131-18]|uniref:DUF4192 domain-containing protein n=1 Tax=Streptomyces sp. MP131-18 TaxID=1857892 RepID=UPI0009A1B41C|nr:DUF4192 domain-containing protein [Streptomyces sp. MP131-18]ONK10755.1 hypothetical protein STBA_14780 [Streptomyces sp. MP131-18]